MNVQQAREWIVKASLVATGSLIVFFLLAPGIGYPLLLEEALPILGAVLPVFAGYLGAAAHNIFRHPPVPVHFEAHNEALLGMLVKGPIIIFGLAIGSLLFAFYYAARHVEVGEGISVNALRMGVAAALTLQSAVTGALVMYLFSVESNSHG